MKEDRSAYCIEIAEYDLETPKAMQKTGRYLYVGFMCHQVAEKALKSIIAKDGNMPPKIHSLIRLTESCQLTGVLTDGQKKLLNELLPLNIEARYPSSKDRLAESLNEQFCADLVARTEEFLSWIKIRL